MTELDTISALKETASVEGADRYTILVANRIKKSFKLENGSVIEVLSDVSLELHSGETVAITGASGAGKSTLLHILGGLESADAGDVIFCGKSLTKSVPRDNAKIRNNGIGFVFQFHHLINDLTTAENVALPLLIRRASKEEISAQVQSLLRRVDMTQKADQAVRQLSGGEQQRIAVARAVINRPRLILADEPTGNLDEQAAESITSLLFSLARDLKSGLLIATHNESLARQCDRILRLENGQLMPLTAAN